MFCVSPKLFPGRTVRLALLFVGALTVLVLLPITSRAQRPKSDDPIFSDFKGVRIGMSADEARKKLGTPRDKSAEQDLYVFNETQAVQVYYDKAGTVSAISIDFMDGASGAPTAKDVLGMDADSRADGSLYKMTRYPKAGYWVSYNRTAGSSPTTTVTMQKIDH